MPASSRSCVKAPQAVLKSAKTRTDEANLDKNTMSQDRRPHDQGTGAALCRIKASSDRGDTILPASAALIAPEASSCKIKYTLVLPLNSHFIRKFTHKNHR